MGVFSMFSKKKRKGSPAVGGSTRRPGPAEPLIKMATGSTRRPGPADWVLTTASGSRAMTKVTPKTTSTPKASASPIQAVKPQGKTFSSAKKTKIPSYNKVPEFAKDYIRVPQRTFIRDLSDVNLKRTFGKATTGTPKASKTATIKADPFAGLPPVDLPTLGTPRAPQIKSGDSVVALREPRKADPIKAIQKDKGVPPSHPITPGLGAALIAGSAAVGAGATAIAMRKTQDPRESTGRRGGVERRTKDLPHPFPQAEIEQRKNLADRRNELAQRRSREGSSANRRATAIAMAQKIKPSLTPEEFDMLEAARAKDLKRERLLSEEQKPAPTEKPKVRGSRKGKVPKRGAASAAPAVPPANAVGGKPLAGKVAPPAPSPVAPTGDKAVQYTEKRVKERRDPTRKLTGDQQGSRLSDRRAGDDWTKDKLGAATPKAAAGALPKSGFVDKRKAVRREEVSPKTDAPIGRRVSTGGRRVGDVGKVDQPMSTLPSADTSKLTPAQKKVRHADNLKKIAELEALQKANQAGTEAKQPAQAQGRQKGYRFRLGHTGVGKVQERPHVEGDIDTVTRQTSGEVRKAKRRARMNRDRAGVKVGISLSGVDSLKQAELARRKQLMMEFDKKKGITRLSPAGEEVMHPERFQEQKSPYADVQRQREGKSYKGKVPTAKPAEKQPASAKPITDRKALLQELEKARRENARLKGQEKTPPISTTGNIKATSPPAVVIKRNPLAPKQKTGKVPSQAQPAPKATPTPSQIIGESKGGGKRRIYRGKVPRPGGKLGVAALIGAGVGATMAGSEAKASTGSATAAVKAGVSSLYEDGKEMAKYALGAGVAARIPGAAGKLVKFGLGKALTGLAVYGTGYTLAETATEGYGAFRASREAKKQKKASQAKYGTIASATATRHARERARGLRK